MKVLCTNCRLPYPENGVPYRCPRCSGFFDFDSFPDFDLGLVVSGAAATDVPGSLAPGLDFPGIWRYRHSFGLPAEAPVISLGEGDTSLVWAETPHGPVAFKCEYQNPTGSFKDRGMAPLVSFLASRGVTRAAEDSSGNAGASFAAYAARAGLQAQVYAPDSASGPKRAQIQVYGAELVRIMGPRANAAQAVLRAVEAAGETKPMAYASHAYLPFNLPGYATLAYELYHELGGAPGSVVLPVGQGGLLLGIQRGFAALQAAGLVENLPQLYGVQARACAPLWALASYGPAGLGWVAEGETLAEGIRISHPVRGDAVLQAVASTGGGWLAVDEAEILPGRDQLARRGFYVEPTSAVVWAALEQLASEAPRPLVAVLTGSGLKSAS